LGRAHCGGIGWFGAINDQVRYTRQVKIALAQINPTVGDFEGNTAKILAFTRHAIEGGARLVVFPELSVCGYPPADLLEKASFVARAQQAVEEIAASTAEESIAMICGTVTPAPQGSGKRVYNAAAAMRAGRVEFVQPKTLLPFYDVFDEQRYFASAESRRLWEFEGDRIAITICEDAWNDKYFWQNRLYRRDPVEELMQAGGSLILNISASPYWRNKRQIRTEMLAAIAKRHGVPVLMVNQVGGNDSLIFDGTSVAFAPDGSLTARGKSFEEDIVFVDTAANAAGDLPAFGSESAAVYSALVLGTRDYVRKCGFTRALIAVSGGVDSALVAAIAVDALGAENVLGIGMPSPYSSQGSIDDSRRLAANLGIRFEVIGISDLFDGYNAALAPLFVGQKPDITEENIQSRIRGSLMMALSNKFSALVMTTGNKSEMSVGYCTLYGDMVGALAVIGDVMKTHVYELCHYLNCGGERIPAAILEKHPSAELRPDQKDTDSLPPYDVLDPILEAYVERYETPEEIAQANGFSLDLVRAVVKLVERSEYKRQQAAPVLKVTSKSFGMGRRFPIAVKVQV
jgi:NAD+ synthase (glutamine-hydrolysing)